MENYTKDYLEDALKSFLKDPPDSEFQRGYLSALMEVYAETVKIGDLGLYSVCAELLSQ